MSKKKKIGLLFGSFNPIHIGHLIIANYFTQYSDTEEVWLVVSPQNPFKADEFLLDENIRYKLVSMALNDNKNLKACDIEFQMDIPSYTVKTLAKLINEYPDYDFVLLIGSDNLDDFDKWKDYERIFELAEIYVYPRPGFKPHKFINHEKVKQVSAPMIEISSSFIRKSIKNKKDPKYLMPSAVYDELMKNKYFE